MEEQMNATGKTQIRTEKMLPQIRIKIPKGIFINIILGYHFAGIAYRHHCTHLWVWVRLVIYHPALTCATRVHAHDCFTQQTN